MGMRILLGILLGGAVGLMVGLFGQRAGGACPLTCNPYGGALYGAILGAVIASMAGPRAPRFTPSQHLISVRSEEAFEQQVLGADTPVLVEFYTPQCGYCRMLEPVLHSLADSFHGRAAVAKVNVVDLSANGHRYHVEVVPTLLLFAGGREVERVVGYKKEKELAALLERHVPTPAATAGQAP